MISSEENVQVETTKTTKTAMPQENIQPELTLESEATLEDASLEQAEAVALNEESSDSLKWYLLGGLAFLGGGGALLFRKSDKGGSQDAVKAEQKQENLPQTDYLNFPKPSEGEKREEKQSEEKQSQNSSNAGTKLGETSSDTQSKPITDEGNNTAAVEKPIVVKSYQYDVESFKLNSRLDSDKDGLLDILDPNPNSWNVSERDLRAFSTLSYKDQKELEAIFNGKDLSEWAKINEDKEGFNHSFSEKESKDFVQNWELVSAEHKGDFLGSGLDYSVFGQGKKSNGGYEQIVFAFRGSKGKFTNFQDWYADLKALRGKTPTQAEQLKEEKVIKDLLDKSDTVYVTGHSLGGYLSQYFAAYNMQQTPELQAKMKHSAIFNPLPLLINDKSPDALKLARINNDRLVNEKIDNFDVVSNNQLYKTNSYVINGEFLADGGVPKHLINDATIGGAALGGIGLGLLGLLTGGLGLLAGIGAIAGGIKGNSLAKEVIEKIGDGFGTYENAVRLESEIRDWLASHSMVRFYDKTDDLIQHFSFGSRHDKWQDGSNAYTKDSDNDGIADVVERYFYSDPNDANSVIAYAQLDGEQNGNDTPVVLYRLGNDQIDFSSQSLAKTEHILGNDMDNRLDGGVGNNILLGGKGKDIFVLGNNNFKNQETNLIVDFDAKEDKLDLSALKLSQITEGALFSNEAKENVALHWNAQTQTLNYQLDNQTFILAQFLNQTEVTMENILV